MDPHMSVVPSDQQPDSRYKSCVAATNCLSVQVDEASNHLPAIAQICIFFGSADATLLKPAHLGLPYPPGC
jgi:hypothetical protein